MAIEDPTERSNDGAERPPRVPGSRGASRVIAIVILSVLAMYAVRLTGRMYELQRASESEQRLQAEVKALESEVIALETAQAGAGSDAFTERWAREERGWSREGDRPLQIVEATSTPAPAPGDAPSADDGFFDRIRRWLAGPATEEDRASP